MSQDRHPCRAARALGAVAMAAFFACSALSCSEQSSIERYIPSDRASKGAIEQAFDAWKQGTAAGPVPGTSPVVHVTDNYRKPGEKLSGYRILGEVPGDTPRCYAVQLTFDPPREERARFVVVGIDPLWVFRLEDYQLLSHWEHKMDSPEPGVQQEEGRP
jgi:hypothetical protein